MLNQEEVRKKYANLNANGSSKSLISMKDYRKPNAVSREKSKTKQKDYSEEYNAKPCSFKSMKEKSQSSKQRKEYPKQTIVAHDQNHGISINVNIQNLIAPKNTQNIKTDKDEPNIIKNQKSQTSNEQKRPRKFSNVRPDDGFEFQCTEEFIYKKSNILEQPKPKNTMNDSAKINPQASTLRKKEKQKNIDFKEAMKKFETECQQINANFDYESLVYLDNRQQHYLVQPDFIEKKQKNFTWLMRAFMIQWMMQVCYQFSLKRQTFHISVNLVDRYLERQHHLAKTDFQLVGLGAMFIASKLQEFQAKSSEQFQRSANKSYTSKQIKQMQRKITRSLNYSINPPTLYRWGNRLMVQWDTFIKQHPYAQRHPVLAMSESIYFKQCDENSYVNYRQLMQFLDCSLLDVQTYQYNPKLLVCGFMYLILGKQINSYDTKSIVKEFPATSRYLIDDENLFNDLFNNFLNCTFGFPIIDILPVVQYCATYFLLPANVDKPLTPNEDDLETMQLHMIKTCISWQRKDFEAFISECQVTIQMGYHIDGLPYRCGQNCNK